VRIAHLSDPHFGADDPAVVAGLTADVTAARADVVLVSGDLTMRARRGQFAAARAFLDGLGVPWLGVPGNHDLPLDRPLTRWFRPLRAYGRFISADPEPLRRYGDLQVLGLSTARGYYWKGGRVSAAQSARIASLPTAGLTVVVMHHPVFRSVQRPHSSLVRGAARAVRAAVDAGVDVILCGHDHVAAASDLSSVRPGVGRRVIGVMAGTCASVRVRAGEPQSWNLLEWSGDDLRLSVRAWDGRGFVVARSQRWSRTADGWI
jgi:3',5'-cyclic AMP phosphodiesterase CpdA